MSLKKKRGEQHRHWWHDMIYEYYDNSVLTEEVVEQKRSRESMYVTESDMNGKLSHIIILGKQ